MLLGLPWSRKIRNGNWVEGIWVNCTGHGSEALEGVVLYDMYG
jgi:hypothetical protein